MRAFPKKRETILKLKRAALLGDSIGKAALFVILLSFFAVNAFAFSFPSFNISYTGNFFDSIDLPSLSALSLVDTIDIPADGSLYTAKLSSSSKYDIVYTYVNVSGTTRSSLRAYKLSGSNLALAGLYSNYKYFGKDTWLGEVANPSPGYLYVGGNYHPSSSLVSPLVAQLTYSGGTLGSPSPFSLPSLPSGNRSINAMASGQIAGNSYTDTAYVMAENLAFFNHKARIYVDVGGWSTSPSLQLPGDFTSLFEPELLEIGDFSSAYSGNELAFSGMKDGDSHLELLRVSETGSNTGVISRLLSRKPITLAGKSVHIFSMAKANLDSDPQDELIVGGIYSTSSSSWETFSDLVQVYDYSPGSGWIIRNEYKNATGETGSMVNFVGAADVDYDGKLEIVAVTTIWKDLAAGYSYKPLVNLMDFNATGTKPHLISSDVIGPTNPTASNHYQLSGAALADFNGDGAKDLAVAYQDKYYDKYRLSVYEVGGDMTPPNVSIYYPNASTFYNNATIYPNIKVIDYGTIKSVKVKLNKSGYDSGFKTATKQSCPSCAASLSYYYSNFSLAGLPAGNYTLYAEALDNNSHKGTATKKITILAAAAPVTYPNMTIYSPAANSWFYNNSTITVKFQAYDADGINISSLKAKLMNANYTSGALGGVITWNPPSSKARNFTTNISLVGRKPGTYYLYTYAYDTKGYGSYRYIYVFIYATPAAPAPAPEPEVPVETPAVETPIEPETPPVETPPAPEGPAVETPPTPEAPPAETPPEPETPPTPETPPAPETPGPETPPAPSSTCPVDASICGPGTIFNPLTCKCNPTEPETPPTPPSGPGTATPPADASAATQSIKELEVKIAAAKGQGVDVLPFQQALDKAKLLQETGKYSEAALEAEKGIAKADAALNAAPPSQPDYTIYIIAGAAIVVLLVIAVAGAGLLGLGGIGGLLLLLLGRKSPAPPAAPSKPEPAEETEEEEPKEPAKKPAKKAKKGGK